MYIIRSNLMNILVLILLISSQNLYSQLSANDSLAIKFMNAVKKLTA